MASSHQSYSSIMSESYMIPTVQPTHDHQRTWALCSVCHNKVFLDTVKCFTPNLGVCQACQERGRSVDNMDFSSVRTPQSAQVESKMKARCDFYPSGCDRDGPVDHMQRHRVRCGFRDILCYEPTNVLSPSRWDDCNGTKVPLPMFQRHLSEVHSYPIYNGPTVSIIRGVEPPLEYCGGWKRWYPISILHDGLGFLWHCYVYSPSPLSGGIIYTWISILADQGWANKYLYKLEVEMPTNRNIRWTWDLPVVQYHDFSMPSDHSATIPVGTLEKMVCKEQAGYGTFGFEMKLTISNMIRELENVQQPTSFVNRNNLIPIQTAAPASGGGGGPPAPSCSHAVGGNFRRN